jgi:hypothetical protein
MSSLSTDERLNFSLERDAEIGRDTYLRLQRLNQRLCRYHGMDPDRAADFMLAGVLFLAADLHGCSLDEAVELAAEIARSVQEDELPAEPRH